MKALYLFPAAVLLLGVIALPLVIVLPEGLAVVHRLARDPILRQVLWTTAAFTGISVALELFLGVLAAVILAASFRLRGVVRAVALLPWALPTAVMAMSWRWILNDTYGIANDLPMRLGILKTSVAWLGRPDTAFFSLILADVWKTTPFVTILALAGLQSIPRDLHEAMNIDGAGPVRRFFLITLPLLRPALALAVTFRIIHAFGIFDLVWVLTGGGPANSTRTVAVYIYDQYFRYGERAYGAAVTLTAAIVMFVVAAGVGALVRGRSQARIAGGAR